MRGGEAGRTGGRLTEDRESTSCEEGWQSHLEIVPCRVEDDVGEKQPPVAGRRVHATVGVNRDPLDGLQLDLDHRADHVPDVVEHVRQAGAAVDVNRDAFRRRAKEAERLAPTFKPGVVGAEQRFVPTQLA